MSICEANSRAMIICVVYAIAVMLTGSHAAGTGVTTCDEQYEAGVQAYLDEDWKQCIESFESATRKYNKYKRAIVNCRVKCQMDTELSDPMFFHDIENLHFYESMVRKTLCLLKCNQNHPDDIPKHFVLRKETQRVFEDRKPYEYLQLCYFQEKRLQESANAVFTYLVRNPKNEMMVKNLRYYFTLPNVKQEEVINYEAEPYVSLYVHGSEAYDEEDWPSVVANMEESLEEYLQAEQECRAFCEGPFNQGWFPDYTSSISNHFTFCLKCKANCSSQLNTLNGERHDDLLPSHYHFLQYAYHKTGNLKAACQAVASYLLFFPDDIIMISNKDFYSNMPKVTSEYFLPRPEAIRYVQRMQYEVKLLEFIKTEFIFDVDKINEIDSNDLQINTTKASLMPPPKTTLIDESNTQYEKRLLKQEALHRMKRTSGRKVRITHGEAELGGSQRFVADGLASAQECQHMINLAEVAAVQGDGYYGNKFPHTNLEKLAGVTLGRAALLVYFGLMDVETLQLFLNLSQAAKDYVQINFKIKKRLYFTYTHLVCRNAIPGAPMNRTDFSHKIHADNCLLQPGGECLKQPPAYTWRDYSAVVYLNNDFDGGEFIFSADTTAKNIQSIVQPICGRLVAFSAGVENLHGVRAVRRGGRCALGLWFTLDHNHQELEHHLANQVLKQIDHYGSIPDQIKIDLQKFIKGN